MRSPWHHEPRKFLTKAGIDQAFVRKVFDYNPDAGILIWRSRSPDTFINPGDYSKDRVCSAWNARHAGKVAGRIDSQGYVIIFINKTSFKAHRLAWLHVYGELPDGMVIDHRDQNRSNNCIANLRLATLSQNKMNSSSCTNTTGVRGVHWYKKYGLWVAHVRINGKQKTLGYFDSLEKAIATRKEAEARYYGEFAP